MTITVTLPDGHTDEYLRFGDNYVKHRDGSLDVDRGGSRPPWSYAAGDGTELEGDQSTWNKRRLWGG